MKTIQIDRDVLRNLYGGCEESMNEVFTEFLNGFNELKQNLSAAFDSGNLLSLKRLLHFHGPSFMYLGIPDVAAMFKGLEQKCAAANNQSSIAADFNELMQSVEECWLEIGNETACFKKAV
jgi:hypothetical protein